MDEPVDNSGSRFPALHAAALLAYSLASLVVFGRHVVASPSSTVVGDAGADKTIAIWSLVWWPHALAHAHDPFDANVVWAPSGIDLAWVTAIPGVSLLAAPLTWTIGEIATYNVLALAAPALSAAAAFALCLRLTQAFWPSLAGGWVFGFSAYELGHLAGHLNLVLVFCVPLCALLVVRRYEGSLSTGAFVVLLTVVLTLQFLISTEIYSTLVLVGALFGVLAHWLLPRPRGPIRETARASALGAALSLVLVSPYLVHAFLVAGPDEAPLRSPLQASADLVNYVVPTRRIWLSPAAAERVANHFSANGAERGAYLGLPLLLAVSLYVVDRRGGARRVIAGLTLAAVVVASFGPELRVDGHDVVPAPWKLPAKLPVTRAILPVRLTMYVSLLAAVAVACWLAQRRSPLRWALVAAGIALVFPDPRAALWASRVPSPVFFARDSARLRGQTALVLPYGGSGWSLAWQAHDRMRYRLIDGHMGRKVIGSERAWSDVYEGLGYGTVRAERLRRFLAAHGVHAIVVAPGARPGARRMIERLRIPSERVDDALLYSP